MAKAIQDGTLTRDDLFITSKLAPKEQGRAQARAAVLASLDKLGLDYIDTYLIHWPGVGVSFFFSCIRSWLQHDDDCA